MTGIKLYRRRYIPDELTHLKDDRIIQIDDDVIVTKWTVLKPRCDFVRGISCYFLKKGYKISRFIDSKDRCIYIYCDVIEICYDSEDNSYTFNDLLADIVIYDNGLVKVLDLAEISEALDKQLITIDQAKNALCILDSLLQVVYSGQLGDYLKYIDNHML